jgi:hypothetical protein
MRFRCEQHFFFRSGARSGRCEPLFLMNDIVVRVTTNRNGVYSFLREHCALLVLEHSRKASAFLATLFEVVVGVDLHKTARCMS